MTADDQVRAARKIADDAAAAALDGVRVEKVIADFETLASPTRGYDNSLVGYYITADDWRRMRAALRSLRSES